MSGSAPGSCRRARRSSPCGKRRKRGASTCTRFGMPTRRSPARGLVETRGPRGTWVRESSANETLDAFLGRVVAEARRTHGLEPQAFADAIRAHRDEGASDRPSVYVIECSAWQCEAHVEELRATYDLDARVWPLGHGDAPPGDGVLLSTFFHYNDVRRKWPRRLKDVHFLTIGIDPHVQVELEALRGSEEATARPDRRARRDHGREHRRRPVGASAARAFRCRAQGLSTTRAKRCNSYAGVTSRSLRRASGASSTKSNARTRERSRLATSSILEASPSSPASWGGPGPRRRDPSQGKSRYERANVDLAGRPRPGPLCSNRNDRRSRCADRLFGQGLVDDEARPRHSRSSGGRALRARRFGPFAPRRFRLVQRARTS